jgi:plastocyanin
MMERGRRVAGTAKWAIFAALATGAFGCELIAAVDRSLIDGAGGGTSTSTGGGGGGTSTSTGGGGGGTSTSTGGGGGGMPGCAKATDCADPGNECVTRTCDDGKCGTAPVAIGTAVAAQTAGDCKSKQCDGNGVAADVNDDADLPDDKKACTDDACTAGVPSNKPTAAGTTCGANLTCDGNGNCAGCASASDCPGQDTECQARICTAGVCGTTNTPAGTPLIAQTSGDCQSQQCDGSGAMISVADNVDLPVDNNACTDDICTAGAPSNPNTMAGGVCTDGGTVCDGSGACVTCLTAATCPGQDNECQTRTCIAGACGISFMPAGTPTATQVAGDCKKNACDGAGTSSPANDDTDLPNDNNLCTGDVCTAGVVGHPFEPSGTPCGAGQSCNATGSCTGCTTASDCPGQDTECQARTCTASVCGFSFTAAGTVTAAQTPGDCKRNTCDGAGTIVPATDDTDLPVDNAECTSDVCTAGAPSNPPTASGSACTQMGGTVCSGSGACVECLVASTCPGTDTDCKARTCTAGVCGFADTAAGTVTSTQTLGDCIENQCDGNGASAPTPKNTDLPVDDGNQCTGELCTAGVPSHPPAASGTTCNQNGGFVCNATSSCVECTIGADCADGVCTNDVCVAPSCTDGVKNGGETGLDCGGSCSTKCALGTECSIDGDCTSGMCTGNVCSQVNGCDLSTATDLTGGAPVTVTFANGNFTYAPKCIKVTQGTVVTFNGGFASHPLTAGAVVAGAKVPAATGPFVPATSTGTTKDFPMTSAGTFPYYCDPHALGGMTGAVFVVP